MPLACTPELWKGLFLYISSYKRPFQCVHNRRTMFYLCIFKRGLIYIHFVLQQQHDGVAAPTCNCVQHQCFPFFLAITRFCYIQDTSTALLQINAFQTSLQPKLAEKRKIIEEIAHNDVKKVSDWRRCGGLFFWSFFLYIICMHAKKRDTMDTKGKKSKRV